MPRPSDARSRLVRAAAKLFRQRGYAGVGLTEILEASDAPKGSFYHHFPEGKEQLAEETIRLAGQDISRIIDQAMEISSDFPSGLRRLVSGMADWFEGSGFREGCPVTSIALDTVPQLPRHAEAVRGAFEGWEDRLVHHARRLGQPAFGRAEAEHLLALLEGGWILARVYQSKGPFLRAAETFLRNLGQSRSKEASDGAADRALS